MRMRGFAFAAVPALAAALVASGYFEAGAVSPPGGIVAKPIPPGYNFPTAKATIDGWIAAGNVGAIRGHAWDLWAGMTAASGQIYQGKNLPIWDTWFGSEELFPAPGALRATSFASLRTAARQPTHKFIQPHQFTHDKRLLTATAALGPADARVVSFNKFDPDAAAFIVTPHPGPGKKNYSYNTAAGLNALNNAWPTGTSGQDRGIVDFTDTSIETKPVMSLVKAAGLTPLPLWQGPAGATNATNPTPNTWKTCVLIDPKGTTNGVTPATAAQISAANKTPGLACTTYLYGSLNLLYHFVLSAADAKAYNNAQGGHAAAGDFAVLSAMHVNTKEIKNWTWQTFYWQPGADTPNGFPGSKAGQPANVVSPWNNYAMCTAYDQVVKPGSSQMQVCFNPYLETSPSIPAGITSNCMSCHGVGVVNAAASPYPPAYKSPIDFFHDATYFNNKTTHTDFSWAVPDDAQ